MKGIAGMLNIKKWAKKTSLFGLKDQNIICE